MEEKYSNYNKNNLSEFRKSIQSMGNPIKNGTLEIPMMTGKGKRIINKVDINEILRTPYADILSWRKYSRIYFANPLYRRLLEYFANIYYNQYIVSPLFNENKKPNKKKFSNDYNTVLRILDEDLSVENFTTESVLNILIEGQTFLYIEGI